jgi:hypothetical protein
MCSGAVTLPVSARLSCSPYCRAASMGPGMIAPGSPRRQHQVPLRFPSAMRSLRNTLGPCRSVKGEGHMKRALMNEESVRALTVFIEAFAVIGGNTIRDLFRRPRRSRNARKSPSTAVNFRDRRLRVFRLGALHVLRGLRIETDDIARFYELRHQDFDAIVEFGWLEGIILLLVNREGGVGDSDF